MYVATRITKICRCRIVLTRQPLTDFYETPMYLDGDFSGRRQNHALQLVVFGSQPHQRRHDERQCLARSVFRLDDRVCGKHNDELTIRRLKMARNLAKHLTVAGDDSGKRDHLYRWRGYEPGVGQATEHVRAVADEGGERRVAVRPHVSGPVGGGVLGRTTFRWARHGRKQHLVRRHVRIVHGGKPTGAIQKRKKPKCNDVGQRGWRIAGCASLNVKVKKKIIISNRRRTERIFRNNRRRDAHAAKVDNLVYPSDAAGYYLALVRVYWWRRGEVRVYVFFYRETSFRLVIHMRLRRTKCGGFLFYFRTGYQTTLWTILCSTPFCTPQDTMDSHYF